VESFVVSSVNNQIYDRHDLPLQIGDISNEEDRLKE